MLVKVSGTKNNCNLGIYHIFHSLRLLKLAMSYFKRKKGGKILNTFDILISAFQWLNVYIR